MALNNHFEFWFLRDFSRPRYNVTIPVQGLPWTADYIKISKQNSILALHCKWLSIGTSQSTLQKQKSVMLPKPAIRWQNQTSASPFRRSTIYRISWQRKQRGSQSSIFLPCCVLAHESEINIHFLSLKVNQEHLCS